MESARILQELVRRVAEAGRLRVAEERAAQMLHAAGSGVTLTLIWVEPKDRDPGLSGTVREVAIGAVTTDAPTPAAAAPVGAAVHLRALLPHISAPTDRERALLQEWLDRVAGSLRGAFRVFSGPPSPRRGRPKADPAGEKGQNGARRLVAEIFGRAGCSRRQRGEGSGGCGRAAGPRRARKTSWDRTRPPRSGGPCPR